MKNCQLILNSNSLCVICLSEVEAKVDKADLFPLHHFTSKINSNLGEVFKDVTVPWAPNAVMDRLEVLADVCEGCADLCEELLYKFQDDVGRENCIKLILDKMEGAGLKDKYTHCGSPSAVFYAGIVDRLRKEIIEKLHLKPELEENSNQLATGALAGLQGIPNLLNIPDVPISQICTYLSFKNIKNCTTVSKHLRHLVFPSFIKSSFICFQNQSQIPAMIDFIKAVATNTKKGVNLLIEAMSFDQPDESDSALLNLFQECGSHITHLKLSYSCDFISSAEREKFKGFLMNCFEVARSGNELLPNLKKLDLYYYSVDEDRERDDFEIQMLVAVAFLKAVFMNSSSLKELKMKASRDGALIIMPPALFQLIATELRLEVFETEGFYINGVLLGHLEPLNLKRVVLDSLDSGETALINFLESQGNTLEYLEFGSRCHFTFPRMEALETLKLKEQYRSGPIFNQAQLPSLKTVDVIRCDEDYLKALLQQYVVPTTSVKELRLSILTVDNAYLTGLSVFKCLSKLEVPVASELTNVWKDLGGLEELTLLPNDNGTWGRTIWIDEIIMGLKIEREFLNPVTDEDIRKYEKKYKGTKSLALLKRLRLLRIRQNFHGQRLMLSDIPFRLVLMKMESLKCIDFCGIHPSFVGASREVLDEMGKKMDLYFGKERDWKFTSTQ